MTCSVAGCNQTAPRSAVQPPTLHQSRAGWRHPTAGLHAGQAAGTLRHRPAPRTSPLREELTAARVGRVRRRGSFSGMEVTAANRGGMAVIRLGMGTKQV